MTGTTPARARRGARIAALLVFVLFFPRPALAQGWDLSLGVAAVTEPVYPGSDRSYVAPTLDFRASSSRGAWSWSASLLQGVDVTWFDPDRGLLVGLNVNQGDERHSDVYSVAGFEIEHGDETRRLLAGSPSLSNAVNTTVTLGTLTPIGIVGGAAAYHPTEVEAGGDDELRHGALFSLLHMISVPVGQRFEVATLAQLEFMDGEFARAWYTAVESNDLHGPFAAGAGLRDLRLAAQLRFVATDRVSVSSVVVHTRLLGDAGDSPYTVTRDQIAASVQADYRF
ncbi:MAG TPA: MipA/OmpV family protein [Candidatus Krumholzibacteria bacterium]|nr:MipA/OmpV family protein [Candidatus Krumholzibacteria bacterium]